MLFSVNLTFIFVALVLYNYLQNSFILICVIKNKNEKSKIVATLMLRNKTICVVKKYSLFWKLSTASLDLVSLIKNLGTAGVVCRVAVLYFPRVQCECCCRTDTKLPTLINIPFFTLLSCVFSQYRTFRIILGKPHCIMGK